MIFFCLLFCLVMILLDTSIASAQDSKIDNAITIQDIVELRELSEVSVCAQSKLIAVRIDQPSIVENRVNHEWRIIEWPSGDIRFRADAGDTPNTLGYGESTKPQWSSDCQSLFYRALHNGEVQIWKLDGTSGRTDKVTNDEADVLDFSLNKREDALIYSTSASRQAILDAEADEYRNGILINETILPGDRLTSGQQPLLGRWSTWKTFGLGEHGHLLSQAPPTYKVISIQSGNVRAAKEVEIYELDNKRPEWIQHQNLRFLVSDKGNQAAIVQKKRGNVYGQSLTVGLAVVKREASKTILECQDHRCSADHITLLGWSNDDSSIHFIAELIRGAAGIYSWNPRDNKVETVYETSGLLGALTEDSTGRGSISAPCPILNGVAFCTAADPSNPPRLLAISLSSGKVETVIDPNSALRAKFSVEAERISWKDELGSDNFGVLIYPVEYSTEQRYPLVITTYTCRGFLAGGIADGAPEYVLAENGFLALCIDRNPELENLIDANSNAEARYLSFLLQFRSAIDTLTEQGLVDRTRVGVTGFSLSAQGVSYALSHSNLFHTAALRGIAVFEPAHEPRSRRDMASEGFRYKDHGFTGDEQEDEAIYERLSLTARAKYVTAPILVQASDTEYSWSLPAFAALHKLGKPIEMHVFPDETHQLFQPIHQYVNFTRNADWFRFWLLGEEDAAQEKIEQYERWREMRDGSCANTGSRGEEMPDHCSAVAQE